MTQQVKLDWVVPRGEAIGLRFGDCGAAAYGWISWMKVSGRGRDPALVEASWAAELFGEVQCGAGYEAPLAGNRGNVPSIPHLAFRHA